LHPANNKNPAAAQRQTISTIVTAFFILIVSQAVFTPAGIRLEYLNLFRISIFVF
jgi:hypothetical protein